MLDVSFKQNSMLHYEGGDMWSKHYLGRCYLWTKKLSESYYFSFIQTSIIGQLYAQIFRRSKRAQTYNIHK